MNFSAANGLDQAQNLATPYILRHHLQDMIRSNAFYKDLVGDFNTRDKNEGSAPSGEEYVLRDFAMRNLCDFLAALNNIVQELNKLNTNSLVPAPQLRETIYEVVGGFKAEGDQGSSLSQYANLLNVSLNQIFGGMIQMAGATQNVALHQLQHRVTNLSSMLSMLSTSTSFLQHRVIVDDQGRAVVQLTGALRTYTVEEHPRAFFSGQNTTRRAQYAMPGRTVGDADVSATAGAAEPAADASTASSANLADAGLAEAAANARAVAGDQARPDPNQY